MSDRKTAEEWKNLGLKIRTKDEWEALVVSEDPLERRELITTLKALDFTARAAVSMPTKEAIKTVLAYQPRSSAPSTPPPANEDESEEKPKPKRGRPKKSAAKTRTPAAESAAPAADDYSKTSLSLLRAILEGVEGIAKQQDELAERLDKLEPFVHEVHFALSCLMMSQPGASDDFHDGECQKDFYKKLALVEQDDTGEE